MNLCMGSQALMICIESNVPDVHEELQKEAEILAAAMRQDYNAPSSPIPDNEWQVLKGYDPKLERRAGGQAYAHIHFRGTMPDTGFVVNIFNKVAPQLRHVTSAWIREAVVADRKLELPGKTPG